MKTNITILSGLTDYKKKIAKKIAGKLDMFYVDVCELMEFNLVNINNAIKKAGQNYVNNLEAKTVKTVASYSNSVITLDYSSLNDENSFEIIRESSLIIFLKFDLKNYFKLYKKQKNIGTDKLLLEQKMFEDRNQIMMSLSDIVIEPEGTTQKEIINLILNGISNYYS